MLLMVERGEIYSCEIRFFAPDKRGGETAAGFVTLYALVNARRVAAKVCFKRFDKARRRKRL